MLHWMMIIGKLKLASDTFVTQRWVHGQVIEVGLQLGIMLTPVRTFFKVEEQDWGEWLFALVTGFGSLIVALLVKLATRCDLALLRPPSLSSEAAVRHLDSFHIQALGTVRQVSPVVTLSDHVNRAAGITL